MNIRNLFDLTEDQIGASKMMYNDKVIKCLVAPYHNYNQLEQEVEYTQTTFLFPEREMNANQTRGLINTIVNNPNITGEVRIVTTNQSIITDMIDTSVRILTEGGDVVECPSKTFMANIHDIRYNILENDAHRLSESDKQNGVNLVNGLIEEIQNNPAMSRREYDTLVSRINMIGEPLISNSLMGMVNDIHVV